MTFPLLLSEALNHCECFGFKHLMCPIQSAEVNNLLCSSISCHLRQVKGKELEMTVPDGCQPGDALLMDLLPEGERWSG